MPAIDTEVFAQTLMSSAGCQVVLSSRLAWACSYRNRVDRRALSIGLRVKVLPVEGCRPPPATVKKNNRLPLGSALLVIELVNIRNSQAAVLNGSIEDKVFSWHS